MFKLVIVKLLRHVITKEKQETRKEKTKAKQTNKQKITIINFKKKKKVKKNSIHITQYE